MYTSHPKNYNGQESEIRSCGWRNTTQGHPDRLCAPRVNISHTFIWIVSWSDGMWSLTTNVKHEPLCSWPSLWLEASLFFQAPCFSKLLIECMYSIAASIWWFHLYALGWNVLTIFPRNYKLQRTWEKTSVFFLSLSNAVDCRNMPLASDQSLSNSRGLNRGHPDFIQTVLVSAAPNKWPQLCQVYQGEFQCVSVCASKPFLNNQKIIFRQTPGLVFSRNSECIWKTVFDQSIVYISDGGMTSWQFLRLE